MIKLENISVGYNQNRLLEGVSTHFSAGKITALLGRNGAGKSTLMRAISGLSDVMDGTIFINGQELSSLNTTQLAENVAFVTTEKVRIKNLKCRDLVALGRAPYTNWIGQLGERDYEIVDEALRAVDMESYAHRYLDKISDGECQRVMIARALAQQTPIILLDEPTSFLDMPNRYELCTLLSDLAHTQQKCVLFSTHELDIAISLCDSIALIDSPHLYHLPIEEMVSSGHIERLFSSNTVYFDPKTGSVKRIK